MSELRGWRLRRARDDAENKIPTDLTPRPRKLTWPDVAPPLDLSVDYSREAQRRQQPRRQISARGRREDADELVPFWTAPPGYCRVCGDPTLTRRHRWHPACVAAYNALASSQGFRQAVWDRDHGQCAHCPPTAPPQPRHNGQRCTSCARLSPPGAGRCWHCPGRWAATEQPSTLEPVGWDADHITPLTDGGPNTLSNAQTLCLPHHRAKTAAEARDRAARRSTPNASNA